MTQLVRIYSVNKKSANRFMDKILLTNDLNRIIGTQVEKNIVHITARVEVGLEGEGVIVDE